MNFSTFLRIPAAFALIASVCLVAGCVTQAQQSNSASNADKQTIAIISSKDPSARVFTNQRNAYNMDSPQAADALWTWGDGSADTAGSAVSKVWHRPGTFEVKLSATVNGKRVIAVQTVKVVGAPISSGILTTCAITQNATVQCWGDGNHGFEAYGDFARGASQMTVPALTDVVSVSRASNHSCALKADKTVVCWGYIPTNNPKVGPDAIYREFRQPYVVAGLTDVVSVHAQDTYTCALKSTGSIMCWGDNKFGQLGDGSLQRRYTQPMPVAGLSDAVAMSASMMHACAARANGAVVCWGGDGFGQLGDGSSNGNTFNSKPKPVVVTGLSDAVAVSTGFMSSCALRSNGHVACWGNNNFGQLGDGTTTSKSIPSAVFGLTDASAISVGLSHACALRSNATVVCWGKNTEAQIGDGSIVQKNTPAAVSQLSGVVALSAARSHTCALKADGSAACWGYNKSGALGAADMKDAQTYQAVPKPVAGGAVFLR